MNSISTQCLLTNIQVQLRPLGLPAAWPVGALVWPQLHLGQTLYQNIQIPKSKEFVSVAVVNTL